MTDKELLEEIKKIRETILEENNFLTRCVLANVFVSLGFMDYLIKQAERVYKLEQQNKRYRKYLELIRITGTHGRIISTGEIIRSDEANLAEEALEGEE